VRCFGGEGVHGAVLCTEPSGTVISAKVYHAEATPGTYTESVEKRNYIILYRDSIGAARAL
jgi:hypothetical protein